MEYKLTYYQPCAYFDDGTNIEYGNMPEELASFMVFRTREDCKAWLEDNGYDPGDFAIVEYHDEDIDGPTFIDADGYYEDGTCSVSAYNTEKALNEGYDRLRNALDNAIETIGNPVVLKTPVRLYEDASTLGETGAERPTIVQLDRYYAYDGNGRMFRLPNITDYDDYMMLVDAVKETVWHAICK